MSVISCRWDWCRSSFPSIDALDTHVKHEHIWPMKPMRKAEIALMRRMDLQSLHSSQGMDSSIISRGLIAGVARSKTPPMQPVSIPQTPERPANEEFDTFTQLSSPLQTHSPQRLPASPALEGLMRQDGRSGLSAAVEMFERAHGHKGDHPPSSQHSPIHRPLSQSSGSSQEVVELQLTQEDDAGFQPLLPIELQIETEFADAELRWPTDDELDMLATEETRNPGQPAPKQNHHLGSSLDSARGQNFRCGSLDVPLGVNSLSGGSPISSQAPASQASYAPSEPFVLQTQAPYSSQSTCWSRT